MNRPREDWPRLASYVVSARLAAGFRDRRAFSAVTGITERTIGKLENGQRVSAETLATVAQHVGWKPDSPRMILGGGEPDPAAPPAGAEVLTAEELQILETYREALRIGRARMQAEREQGHERNGRSA